MKKFQKAFTLIEVMIVVIILAILAGFGLPNINKTQERVAEKDAAYNLVIIGAAMEIFRVRNAGYPGLVNVGIDEINVVLNLGIIEQNMDYECTSTPGSFTCTALSTYGWELELTETDGGIPRCSGGPCPVCLPVCPGTF